MDALDRCSIMDALRLLSQPKSSRYQNTTIASNFSRELVVNAGKELAPLWPLIKSEVFNGSCIVVWEFWQPEDKGDDTIIKTTPI